MQLHIRHETTYRYEHPLKYSIQSLRLTPRRDPGQRPLAWRIQAPGRQLEQVDAYGNITHLLTLEEPHRELSIVVQGIVDTGDSGTPQMPDEGPLSPFAYLAPTRLTRTDKPLREFAGQHLAGGAPLRERLVRLNEALCEVIRYRRGSTDVSDDAATVFARGEGVCQDQAHAFIACCRAGNIPARYVSGYFHAGDIGEVASHAWADAWLGEDEGWLSLDITHRSSAGARHCRLAVGRDYLDSAPIRGVRHGGGQERMQVAVSVATSAAQAQQQ
ncbi:MAG TPA: transglutaminase family protein [Steroidobacteraceae bacterium]|nr:transglutaminase family protein [Steroidobacteraceae bacterium]